ncbi:MAG: Cd(II)/Pb(II)-responsive transcriptional regulator [Haliea sp.]|nr:MAG: Cd(II)/Pb(II)-responsive transcriptional regulator [Haliea sp.]
MKIGQLAQATGTQVETIRFYEREGLLPVPPRTEGNYRVYDAGHMARLAFIRHCRCLDMTLDEIRVLLRFKDAPQSACGEVDTLLEGHIGHVVARIRELRALEKELRSLRAQCGPGGASSDCGILQGLEQGARSHDHAAGIGQEGHLRGAHKAVGTGARRRGGQA